MSAQKHSGFTIIEVMLFLAISGALTVAILVGSSVSINQQRYRDSVNSFKGILQEQYSLIGNVINSKQENPVCTTSGAALVIADESSGNKQPRGTSDCLVMGRFILIEPTEVTTYNLIGLPPDNEVADTSDAVVLASYAISAESPEKFNVSWGARIVQPDTNGDVSAGILIIRSPLSGSILTFTGDLPGLTGVQEDDRISHIRAAMQEMINSESMAQKDFCVDSDGALRFAQRQGVRIAARAASQSAVGVIGVDLAKDGVCD